MSREVRLPERLDESYELAARRYSRIEETLAPAGKSEFGLMADDRSPEKPLGRDEACK